MWFSPDEPQLIPLDDPEDVEVNAIQDGWTAQLTNQKIKKVSTNWKFAFGKTAEKRPKSADKEVRVKRRRVINNNIDFEYAVTSKPTEKPKKTEKPTRDRLFYERILKFEYIDLRVW